MKRNILFILAITIVIAGSCKKENKPATPVVVTLPPVVIVPKNPVTLIPDTSAHGGPGKIITYNTPESITKDTIMAKIGTSTVVLYKTGDKQLSLLLPVISSGSYDVSFKLGDQPYTTKAIVDTYKSISDPNATIDMFKNNVNAIIDTLQQQSRPNTTVDDDFAFIKQLMVQFSTNLQSATPAEKLSIAYMIQNSNLNPATFKSAGSIDPDYRGFSVKQSVNALIANKLNVNEIGNTEIGSQGFTLGRIFSTKVIIATASTATFAYAIGAMIAAPSLALVFPVVVSAVLFKMAVKAALNEEGNLLDSYIKIKDFAPDFLLNTIKAPVINTASISTRGTTSVLALSNNKNVWLNLNGNFRTIQQSDLNDPLLGSFITQATALQDDEKMFKAKFDDLKNRFGTYFQKVTQATIVHPTMVKTTAAEKIILANNKYVTISEVSNPDISLTAINDTKGLKITASNPNKNIKTITNFTFKITYNQAALNNNVSKTQSATYTPTIDSVALLKAKVWTAYEDYAIDPDTKQQSCNIIGNSCNVKDIYYVFKNSNGVISCSSWSYVADYLAEQKYTFTDVLTRTANGNAIVSTDIGKLSTACSKGTPYVSEYQSSGPTNVSFGSYRVLNGWLELNSNNTWRQYAKITKLNATALELEFYGGFNQFVLTSFKITGTGIKPGLENVLKGIERFK